MKCARFCQLRPVDQSYPRFVDQRCRLQDVTWPFMTQVMVRQAAHLGENQRNQPLQRFLVPPSAHAFSNRVVSKMSAASVVSIFV
jgi:hypothetical protein